MTSTKDYLKDNGSLQIAWYHKLSPHMSSKIDSTATLPFVEVVIYVLSFISASTGLSVMSCNGIFVTKHVCELVYAKHVRSRFQR